MLTFLSRKLRTPISFCLDVDVRRKFEGGNSVGNLRVKVQAKNSVKPKCKSHYSQKHSKLICLIVEMFLYYLTNLNTK